VSEYLFHVGEIDRWARKHDCHNTGVSMTAGVLIVTFYGRKEKREEHLS
jgi:hypothetical protein